jgi:hypothetical protein
MWDSNGIESVIDITQFDDEADDLLLETIKTGQPQKSNFGSILNPMMLRARFNGQRNYEIYALSASEGITDRDIYEMFTNDPQGSADLVRNKGIKVYSDRATKKAAIV